jgi:hypothetical protein
MSDDELEVLITLDDPWYGPEEDTFHQLQTDSSWRHEVEISTRFEGGANV